jgi:uncharacterized secreted protein with C-terminal beta-propeller domain
MSARAKMHSWPARLGVVAVVAAGAGVVTLLPGASTPASAQGLVPWGDCEDLLQHYRTELERTATPHGLGGGWYGHGDMLARTAGGPVPAAAMALDSASSATEQSGGALAAAGSGPTGTNVQERGVDEPDIAKTSGGLLFVSAQGRLQVLRAGADPELLSSLPLGEGAYGAELLVEGDRVLALVNGFRPTSPVPSPDPAPEPVPEPDPATDTATSSSSEAAGFTSLPAQGVNVVSAVLVDVSDPTSPRVLETLELDGRYLSARLVDGTVRLVTASQPVLPAAMPAEPYGRDQEKAALAQNQQAASGASLAQVLPGAVLRDADGAEVTRGPAVGCDDVHHASSSPQGTSTLVVTTLRPAQGLAALDSTAVTTDGELVYASADRLYVATSRWGTAGPASTMPEPSQTPTTELHAFDTTAADRTTYVGTGSVRGYVYGRWALSEHEGHLRVATTLAPLWGGDPEQSSSSLTVLAERDGALVETGRVDGLGLTEQIYAVRYFGDLATVVTFRQTDPLYVLDLSDVTAPKVLGELKIPGFSTYLHPVGDDRLLGIGMDADAGGRVTGFQVSLFDVSDRSAPVQLDRLALGQGFSPASDDSRAFSYDPSRGLAAMPFYDQTGAMSALGVRVDGDELAEAGRLDLGQQYLQRVLLVDGTALAVSESSVVAGDLGSWERTGSAAFSQR